MQPTGPSVESVKHFVCRNCSWETERAGSESRENADREAIDHYVTTGHSVEASDPSRSPSDCARDTASAAARGQSGD